MALAARFRSVVLMRPRRLNTHDRRWSRDHLRGAPLIASRVRIILSKMLDMQISTGLRRFLRCDSMARSNWRS